MTPTAAPPHLWQEAATLLRQLFALFGEPQTIAQSHTLTRAAHKLLAQWLRGAEALMRHLLLIEALALPVHVKRIITHDPDQPEKWRVSFRVFDGGAAWLRQAQPSHVLRAQQSARLSLSKAARPERSAEKRFFSAWPLAERAEALLRVFNNPAPYAKRLARKLHAQPERAETLTLKPDAHRAVIPEELVIDFTAAYAPSASKRDNFS